MLAGPRNTTRHAYAVPTTGRRQASRAMASPATTKPRLLSVLTGWRTRPAAASQKSAPRSTSAPSQPKRTASASRTSDTTAVSDARTIGRRVLTTAPGWSSAGTGETRSPTSVVTSWSVTHGTRVTSGANASRGHASGDSPLWNTGIISRVHHWYHRTCDAPGRAYAASAASSEGAVARAWCSVHASASASEVPVPSCGLIACAASPTRTAPAPDVMRNGVRTTTSLYDAGSRWSTRSSSGANSAASGRASSRQASRPRAWTASMSSPRTDQNSDVRPRAGRQHAEVVAGAAQALEQAVGRELVRVVDDRPQRAVLVGVVADRHVHRPRGPASATRRSRRPGRTSRGRRRRSRRPARRRPAARPVTGTASSTGTPRATTASWSSVKSVPRCTPSAGTSPGHVVVPEREQRSAGRRPDVDPRHRPRRGPQVVEQPEPVEHLLPHVLQPDPGTDRARVVLLLEHGDVEPAVGQQAGQGRPGHPETDDGDAHGREASARCARP